MVPHLPYAFSNKTHNWFVGTITLDQPEAIGSVEALPCFVGLLLAELLPAAVGRYRCRAVLQRTQDACEDE